MKIYKVNLAVVFIVIILVLPSSLIISTGAQPTSVNVDPSDIVVDVCHPFAVKINITEVFDLYGYEFKLYYNTTFMDGLSVEFPPGHFLEPINPTNLFIIYKDIDDNYNATHGRVRVAVTLLDPESPKSGSGVLVEVTFHCTDEGETALKLDGTVLYDPFGVPISHTTNDGHVASEAPPGVYVSPLETTVPITETFTVNVSVYTVEDLYSWRFNMSFDATSLECLDVQEGSFLKLGGTTQFATPTINNTAGTITGANCSLVAAGSGVNGSGALAIVEFHCKNAGKSILDLKDTQLYNSTSAEIFHVVNDGSVNQVRTVTYRLLAVEKFYSNKTGSQFAMKSAQYLIQNLTRFRNWKNGTWGNYNYRSYVHLLSNATVDPSLTKYYKGLPTRTSILNEITTFLNDTCPGESNDLTIRIFYYVGHTSKGGWGGSRRYMDLTPGRIDDWELDQALTSGDLGNSNCTLVILDTCYAGAYTKNLTRPGRVILTSTGGFKETSWGWIKDTPSPGHWSWFTGHENATYTNGTSFGPLGIIGGFSNAKDRNGDGWRSAREVFSFAKDTTTKYAKAHSKQMTPSSSYGVTGGGIPLIMHHEYVKYYDLLTGKLVEAPIWFPHNAAPRTQLKAVLPATDWPLLCNQGERMSYSLANGSLVNCSVWNTPMDAPIASSASIVEGMVFVGTLGGDESPCSVYALDVIAGEVIWSFVADGLYGRIYSSPAVVDGVVFVGTIEGGGGVFGTLYALDQYTGLLRWSFTSPQGTGGIFASPAVVDGIVFIATMGGGGSGGSVYALNATTGEPLWEFQAAGPIKSSPAVVDGIVFIATMGGGGGGAYLYARDEYSGTPVWDREMEQISIVSTPSVAFGKVFVGTLGGGIYPPAIHAFDEFSGSPLWNYTTSAPVSSSPAVDVDRERVVVGSDDGIIYSLRVTDGFSEWTSSTGPINMSSPAISSNGLIYIGSLDNQTYCLNETTGDIVWIYETGGQIVSSPALTDEHVIISSMSNESVYCIGPPFPLHDVAVSHATVFPDTVKRGKLVNITYTLVNNGNVKETFEAACSYNNTVIWKAPLYNEPILLHAENITLLPGANVTKTYAWDTTDIPSGTYTVIVEANLPMDTQEYEIIFANNVYIGGSIIVTEVGNWSTSFIGLGGYPIVDFAVYNGKLYATADNTLYMYDGSSWAVIYAPTYVVSMEPFGDKLVIGGKGAIYSFDGATFNLVFTVPTYIKVLGVYNNTLYAGTILDKPPTLYYCNGSAENPSNWHMDTAFSTILNFSGPFGSIDSFGVYNGMIYLSSGSVVYAYDGFSWNIVQTFDDACAFLDMKVYNGKLYLATRDQAWRKPYYQGGAGFSGRVIEFDGNNWTTVFDHDYWIYSLETYGGKLYAGTANKILTYNGTDWEVSFNSTIGDYYAISMITYDGEIYAGMGNGYVFEDPSFEALTTETVVVPEFPLSGILLLFMIATLLAITAYKRKSSPKQSKETFSYL